jgi:hypothetical protein
MLVIISVKLKRIELLKLVCEIIFYYTQRIMKRMFLSEICLT